MSSKVEHYANVQQSIDTLVEHDTLESQKQSLNYLALQEWQLAHEIQNSHPSITSVPELLPALRYENLLLQPPNAVGSGKGREEPKKKRKFTGATILSNTDEELTVKITLKLIHIRKLKRHIRETQTQTLRESQPQSQRESQTPKEESHDDESPSKKRRTAPVVKAEGSLVGSLPRDISSKELKQVERQYANTYISIWKDLARTAVPRTQRVVAQAQTVRNINAKKTSILCSRESRRWQARNTRQIKDLVTKARRGMREMHNFWKKNEREEEGRRRMKEKEEEDKVRKEEEEREKGRQERKLEFLMKQTELYSHFVRKTGDLATGESENEKEENAPNAEGGVDFADINDDQLHQMATEHAMKAVEDTRSRARAFDNEEMNFQNPTSLGDITITQPNMLRCTLKEYQIKGLNWLASLYDQGINGILADEMGLGKTVQSISVLTHLAERYNVWGPFLIVTPASTLHNWQQEFAKFVPDFKVLPYWGNGKDRKILRKFWDRKHSSYTKDSPFHVMVTSYQMVVADVQYFQRMKWQYMILDEAQAIKSSSSSRWKSLLSFSCRNRLLLTGTPIQNNMQELWALLHFIMPSLFDSHDEFSDWFAKDIESHAQSNTQLNQAQLKRLHMILKPFMLRRVKKNVQSELGDKIEIDVMCKLTNRQAKYYKMLKSQISILDLIEKATAGGKDESDQSLINLVMQFRKVCNHPELFERGDVTSAFAMCNFAGGTTTELYDTTASLLPVKVPRLLLEDAVERSRPVDLDLSSISALSDKSCGELELIRRNNTLGEHRELSSRRFVAELDSGRFRVPNKIDDLRSLARTCTGGVLDSLLNVRETLYTDSYFQVMKPAYVPKAVAPPPVIEVAGSSYLSKQVAQLKTPLPTPEKFNNRFTPIQMPSMDRFITDSAKLKKLDELLVKLKQEDHRVLVYFQMTKMMDLMEEYLTYKQYRYIRLDGSSKLEDRRDLVHDWQHKPEIFIFLLSTRAGGLGINLTAADTVIFYDSDWNPTIDSQAMDRAHRLGQTRQVTVYRLLVSGTIEERMRDRAKQKEHVQQVVMEGKTDTDDAAAAAAADQFGNATRDVAYWLLDDEEAANKVMKKQEERALKRSKRQ